MDIWVCPACGFEGSDPECPEQCPRCDCQAEKFECPECGYFGHFFSQRPEFCPSCGHELVVAETDEGLQSFDEEAGVPEEPTDAADDDKLAEVDDQDNDDELFDESEDDELDFDQEDSADGGFMDADDLGDEKHFIL
jgi:predicted RNA-binding Zn-ribbon protein involved in translation (DUF1610 family)